jgi:Mn-dependent DtxR family transcriptional regulator
MPSRFEEAIYNLLSREPVTPSEVAKKLKINYRTAKDALMRLAVTRKDVRYKNSGRIHIFWREGVEPTTSG